MPRLSWLVIGLLCFSLPVLAQGRRAAARPWLGIGIEKGKRGVLINNVLKKTPAERAGFVIGDEVVEIDSKPVLEPQQLIDLIQSKGVGYQVEVGYWHGEQKLKKTLALEVQPDALEMLQKLYLGQPSPDFTLKSLSDGKLIKANDLVGKVVLLEFWATWCGACRATQPFLREIAKQRPELVLLAVTGEDEPTVTAFMKKQNFGYPVVLDPEEKANTAFQVGSLPTFFLLDKSGVVRQVEIGGGSYVTSMLPAIDALLAAKK